MWIIQTILVSFDWMGGHALHFFPCGFSLTFEVRFWVKILEFLEQNDFPLAPTKLYLKVPYFTNSLASKPVC